jgi:hypothetical protein
MKIVKYALSIITVDSEAIETSIELKYYGNENIIILATELSEKDSGTVAETRSLCVPRHILETFMETIR